MFSVIRRSHIEQYAGCPYSLYLQLVLGNEPPMSKNAQLGVIVHELIESLSKDEIDINRAKIDLEDAIAAWNVSTDEEYSIITWELQDVGNICLDNFMLIKNQLGSSFESEKNIKFSIDDDLPTISCTLDRIAFDGDKIHIHDWKTGKPMSGKKLVTDLQPPLYIYGVYKEYGILPETFTLHYLQPNKHIVYKKIDDMKYEVVTTRNTYTLDIDEALDRTKKILNDIKHNRFNMPDGTAHLFRCDKLCWFGISGKCRGTQDEQWKRLNEQYAGESAA